MTKKSKENKKEIAWYWWLAMSITTYLLIAVPIHTSTSGDDPLRSLSGLTVLFSIVTLMISAVKALRVLRQK